MTLISNVDGKLWLNTTLACSDQEQLLLTILFKGRKKVSTTYTHVVPFSPHLSMKSPNFSKTVHTTPTKLFAIILHHIGLLCVQWHQIVWLGSEKQPKFAQNGQMKTVYNLFFNIFFGFWLLYRTCGSGLIYCWNQQQKKHKRLAQMPSTSPLAGKGIWIGSNPTDSTNTWLWIQSRRYKRINERTTRWCRGVGSVNWLVQCYKVSEVSQQRGVDGELY